MNVRLRIAVCFLVVMNAAVLCSHGAAGEDVLSYVDPMIGTDGKGSCFPGATTPQGMIQLSPSDDCQMKEWCSGYHYSDSVLKGFAHNHFSGTGLAGMGDFLLMPLGGKLQLTPGTKEDPDSGFRSRFSHEREKASAGYYSVHLDDNDVNVELTASPRVGFHRYTFGKAGPHHVIFDPANRVRGNVKNAGIEIISDSELRGYKREDDASCGDRKVYFYAKFSKPFTTSGVAIDGKLAEGQKAAEAKTALAFVTYEGASNEVVEVAVAISYVDYEGAKANYLSEAPGRSFDQVREEAKALWRDKVSRIQIDGASLAQKRIFYTGMYHSFITPNIISDANGNYMIEGQKYNSPGLVQLSNISNWDTFRALHPLWTIIDQKADAHFVNVLISRYTESKVGLALWEALGHDNCCMPGYPGISVMADAVLKNLAGVDPEMVFKCVRQAAFASDRSSPHYGKDNGVKEYLKLGYVPAEVGCGTSFTMEYNYYDWCIAKLAEKLGKTDDEKLFRQRSIGYRKLYNPEKNYIWPKYADGTWMDLDITRWDGMRKAYISGNIWSYTAYTPHDMPGAIALFGGPQKYAAWLDAMFTEPVNVQGDMHYDINGFIGKYAHGDEPGHQMPYAYDFVQQPWKTQALVREIMTTLYFNTPEGYINNEDCGQMSSWYIFSSLGFYPVCPGDLKYYIGAPLHEKATITLENGKKFTVIANNNPAANKYVQSATLNSKPYNEVYITHDDIMHGGELVFEMGPEPNREWGIRQNLALKARASSNSECRNEEKYKAKNAIDGNCANKGHGEKFPSWGPDKINDPWLKLEWDYDVTIDGIRVFVRCDFPPYGPTEHDGWWKSGTVELSTGEKIPFTLEKTADGQWIKIPTRTVRWIKFTDLVPNEDKWCAFCEVEVTGTTGQ